MGLFEQISSDVNMLQLNYIYISAGYAGSFGEGLRPFVILFPSANTASFIFS